MKKNENSASDPPDAGGSSSSQSHHQTAYESRYNFKIGIYGWRKRCLYILILGLLVMVIVNLALTLWVLKVMEFSSEGMGQLKIVTGGLRLEGTAYVLDSLIASSIRSRRGQPITIESSRNLTLTTRDENGLLNNLIYLGNDRFECLANNFKVMDDRGIVLFAANHKDVIIGSENLRVTGEGGAIFSGSVQTPLVRAESGHDLRLESPTRSLEMRAPSGINIESRAGDIKSMSLNDIKLKSVAGAIRLESSVILMDKIPTAIPSSKPSQSKNHDIYQLCVCNNGKLFLVPPHYLCSDDGNVCR
ncbi:PREDICTED: zeta-sarcoglycan [Nicrophorus vespilloides]|uniref:Zeta-sarcoglycan n=1 Tax=Nicrophorus vespilloides TaxID=110193 RepID=A0ABM1MD67_NICVS|nr:PREDICTED: zeta-sarcoglycan [Nicrophorus vespilloides]XP_017772518.1 PREDICTED: zeta-sarcoglycan [Nicrophorus vespilloides]